MNAKARRRLTLVGLIVVLVAVVLFVTLGSGGTAKALSVSDASSGAYDGKKVQVSGTVAQDSYTMEGATAVFSVVDDADASKTLAVRYDGTLPASFGNGVTAICTGVVSGGTLTATTMVTKCPSKYESAEGALTVSTLLNNRGVYNGQDLKVAGYVTAGSLADVSSEVRFNLNSQGAGIDVEYDGGLPDEVKDGTAVVVSGRLSDDGDRFVATDVSVDASVQSEG